MFLNSINLQNFRSFKQKKLEFSNKTNLIIGPNTVGKSNVLEAIYLLSTGKSFRASLETEMISNNSDFAKINGQLSDQKQLSVVLTRGEINGQKTAKKLFTVNEVGKRWKDFVGHFPAVLFRPEDINIVLGSPAARRGFLDTVLEQIDWQYRACSLTYQKGLRQRNKVLAKIREGQAQRSQLNFWNQLLVKNGEIISQKREELIDFFNNQLQTKQFSDIQHFVNLKVEYDKSAITFLRLEKYKEAETALATTLVGPHRDEIKLLDDKKERNLALFGSRGEQRIAMLALKLAHLEFIFLKKGYRATLLLDDIFSELDKVHRNQVIKAMVQQQTIITATEADLINQSIRDKIKLIEL